MAPDRTSIFQTALARIPRPLGLGMIGLGVVGLAALLAACGSEPADPNDYRPVSGREARADRAAPARECADRAPLRRALFGDLHVHTALSSDAWNYDVEVRPHDAYGYAFGEALRLPPKDAQGLGRREVRIDRPLDFAAVTDHAEFLGEQRLCSDPSSVAFTSETCEKIRASDEPIDSPLVFEIANPWPTRKPDVCGDDGERCLAASLSAWDETIEAAEAWNDTSQACERTTFIAFEYSSLRLGSNLHRNVIFRNSVVPARPISYMDVQREWELWQLLRDACTESGTGCDALAIPHNSNISNGRMFAIDYPGTSSLEEERERAALRAAMEPLVEIMQHKGDSECVPEMASVLGAADELCAFEKFEQMRHLGSDGKPEAPAPCWDFFADSLPHLGPGACVNHRNYVRYVLTEGLAEEARLGINPFKLGIMASTDTHNGMAGGVSESDFPGHVGVADAEVERRLSEIPGSMGNMANNPGGLVGVWAEANSRDAIFDALQRREVFGTSGPRIRPRLFASWDYPDDLCSRDDLVAVADRQGVPMGADLLPAGDVSSAAPAFAAFATADPGTNAKPGADLQRIQIIKGWVGEDGALHQQVYDVAGRSNGASVNPETCEPTGAGARQLCGVWRDPDFEPDRSAVYYARVLENPTCRYSALQCQALAPNDRPPGCAHEVMRPVQQERAWTSPIWYSPGESPVS